MAPPPNTANNNRIATIMACFITVAWGVSFIVDIFDKSYDPSPSVHALMMMAAGAVFGEGLIKSRNGPNGGDTNDDEKGQK